MTPHSPQTNIIGAIHAILSLFSYINSLYQQKNTQENMLKTQKKINFLGL